MKVEQAIEVLTRTITVNDGMQETAIRMAVQALRLLRWIPVKERHPEPETPVLGVAYGFYDGHDWLDGDICIVEWEESCNLWTLTDDEESNPVQVSHWMPLPVPPMEDDHDPQ